MSKTIYDEALESRSHISAIIQNQKTHLTWEEEMHHLANITRVLLQAEKQEQEHIEYSKKVQEQFSNDTKRIGELESKLIKQEKLIQKIKENLISGHFEDKLEHTNKDGSSKNNMYNKVLYDMVNAIESYVLQEIKELENNGKK